MERTSCQLKEIKLAGIEVATSYENELDWASGKIFPCVQKYFHQQLFDKIPHRLRSGVTSCAYTRYESDYKGQYTYFIGEEVDSFENIPSGLTTLLIPQQNYIKLTTQPGGMPHVIRDAWQSVWQMSPQELGGTRNYHTDFEIYDERASDHNNIVLDLYIGVKV